MARYSDTVVDQFGNAVPGVQIAVLTRPTDGSPPQTAYLTDDNGLQLGNPVSTDGSGAFFFNAASGDYTLKFRLASASRDFEVKSVTVGGFYESDFNAMLLSDSANVLPAAFPPAAAIDFPALYKAGETPIQHVRTVGGATAVIGTNADLEAVADYTDGTKAVAVPSVVYGTGFVRFQVRRGSNNANSAFMVRFQAASGDTRAIWSSDGIGLSYGLIAADGTVTLLGNGAAAFVGTAGQLVWIELQTPALYAGLTWWLRAWVDGGTRPADGSAISAVYTSGQVGASTAAGRRLNEGRLMPASIGSVPTRLARVAVADGRAGTKLTSQAALVGRWFPSYDGGKLVMGTNRGGSRFRFLSTGTNDINISYVATPDGNAAYLDVFVNGMRQGSPVKLDGSAGSPNTKSLLTGLDPALVSQIEVRVRGVDVFSNMWYRGAACLIEQLTPTLTAGKIAPWPDPRPKALFIGDSITAGSVARGTSADPVDYGGDISWPVLSADYAGMAPIVSGLGGTGLTVPMDPAGGGTSPAATEHAFNYMAGRPIDTAAENIKVIVVNLGTNDLSQSVTTSDFQAAYTAFLQSLIKAHPSAGSILAMYPFGQAYAVQIFNAVGLLGDPRIAVVDTSGPTWAGITYTDGTHPDVAGHAKIAGVFGPVLKNALTGALL